MFHLYGPLSVRQKLVGHGGDPNTVMHDLTTGVLLRTVSSVNCGVRQFVGTWWSALTHTETVFGSLLTSAVRWSLSLLDCEPVQPPLCRVLQAVVAHGKYLRVWTQTGYSIKGESGCAYRGDLPWTERAGLEVVLGASVSAPWVILLHTTVALETPYSQAALKSFKNIFSLRAN